MASGQAGWVRVGGCQKSIPILRIILPTVFKTGSCCFPDQLFRDMHICWILIFDDLWVKKEEAAVDFRHFLAYYCIQSTSFLWIVSVYLFRIDKWILFTLKKTWFADTLTVFFFFTF